jgi:Phospholipase_D-nuclease N-terminal
MIDVEGLFAIALFMFWVWALLDCIATDSSMCRNLPKAFWVILILILPDIGALVWVLLGRPERASWRPGSTDYSAPRRPVGLEDSPRYTAAPGVTDRRSEELDRQLERWEREQRENVSSTPLNAAPVASPELEEWKQQLDRRDLELQRRELELRQRELDRRELEQRERDEGAS